MLEGEKTDPQLFFFALLMGSGFSTPTAPTAVPLSTSTPERSIYDCAYTGDVVRLKALLAAPDARFDVRCAPKRAIVGATSLTHFLPRPLSSLVLCGKGGLVCALLLLVCRLFLVYMLRSQSQTALLMACTRGHREIARLLLEARADVNRPNVGRAEISLCCLDLTFPSPSFLWTGRGADTPVCGLKLWPCRGRQTAAAILAQRQPRRPRQPVRAVHCGASQPHRLPATPHCCQGARRLCRQICEHNACSYRGY